MLALNESQIRSSFINASRREAAAAPLPPRIAEVDWDALDFLGWVDPRLPRRAYAVVPTERGPVGFVLTTEAVGRPRPTVCVWCEDVRNTDDVVLYVARRAGSAGRDGNSIGTMLHADFSCSAHVRRPPTPHEAGSDPAAFVAGRITGLRLRTSAFAERLRDGT